MDNGVALRMILIALAAVALIVLITQYSKRTSSRIPEEESELFMPRMQEHNNVGRESFGQSEMPEVMQPIKATEAFSAQSPSSVEKNVVKPSEPLSNEDYRAIDFQMENKIPTECFPKERRLTKEDLLPKDAANSKWAQVNPAGQGDVKDQNFLTAGFHIGINTVGQSLRNANYQLRSEPPNPRAQVSPWNQTTIEYDTGRRNFEIGQCD